MYEQMEANPSLEFDHYLSWGLNRMTFCESGRTLRVEHRLVKRTEEES